MVSDFVDSDDRILEARGFKNQLQQMEWYSATSRLKKYLSNKKSVSQIESSLDENLEPKQSFKNIELNGIHVECLTVRKTLETICNEIKLRSSPRVASALSKVGVETEHIVSFQQKILSISKSTRLRSFGVRFSYGLLYFGDSLCRFGIKSNSKCNFCGAEDSFNHAFFECNHIQTLRNVLATKLGVNPNKVEWLLGTGKLALDIVIFFTNYAIHIYYHRREKIAYKSLIALICNFKNIEEQIANTTLKLVTFDIRWLKIKCSLSDIV